MWNDKHKVMMVMKMKKGIERYESKKKIYQNLTSKGKKNCGERNKEIMAMPTKLYEVKMLDVSNKTHILYLYMLLQAI